MKDPGSAKAPVFAKAQNGSFLPLIRNLDGEQQIRATTAQAANATGWPQTLNARNPTMTNAEKRLMLIGHTN